MHTRLEGVNCNPRLEMEHRDCNLSIDRWKVDCNLSIDHCTVYSSQSDDKWQNGKFSNEKVAEIAGTA